MFKSWRYKKFTSNLVVDDLDHDEVDDLVEACGDHGIKQKKLDIDIMYLEKKN